jgi:hypothetical protein
MFQLLLDLSPTVRRILSRPQSKVNVSSEPQLTWELIGCSATARERRRQLDVNKRFIIVLGGGIEAAAFESISSCYHTDNRNSTPSSALLP